jgi:hypothetical protein
MYLLTSSVLVACGLQEWIIKFKLKKRNFHSIDSKPKWLSFIISSDISYSNTDNDIKMRIQMIGNAKGQNSCEW